jgi:hypothetical protein
MMGRTKASLTIREDILRDKNPGKSDLYRHENSSVWLSARTVDRRNCLFRRSLSGNLCSNSSIKISVPLKGVSSVYAPNRAPALAALAI